MIILLTGLPGMGKTTVLEKFIQKYGEDCFWILSREIRDGSQKRVGFEAILSNGEKGIFAHKEKILSKYAVGDYQVDLEMIDKLFTVNILSELKEPRRLLIVDEIGRMEMLSERFVQAIDALFEANVSVLATIRQGDSWAEKYKTHPGVTVIEVTEQNRERLPEELVEAFLET